MPDTKRAEPLVKTAVTLTRRQLERLRRRGERVGGSVSYYVRDAIDKAYPETDDSDKQEEVA